MRTAFALSVAALAGSALAAPSYGRPHYKEVKNVHVVVETVVHTVYVTEGYPAAKPTSSPAPVYSAPVYSAPVYSAPVYSAPVYSAPAKTTVVYESAPAPTSSVYVAPPAPTTSKAAEPVYTPAPEPTTTTTPAPAPETTTAAPAPSASGYMAIVDEWRAKLGLTKLACDAKLEANALDTVTAGNGVMVHKLNPGTYGQVLAPGDVDSFEHVFVGGWLCEIPTLPGLDGICATQSEGWSYEGQTGHAEILTSPNYSKIGCQIKEGIWCCDLA